jgi:hypothetical protein
VDELTQIQKKILSTEEKFKNDLQKENIELKKYLKTNFEEL